MGTNYYIGKVCSKCKHFDEVLHIGKSSYGWCFSLHVTNEIKSLDDWLVRLKNLQEDEKIYDEYGNEMLLIQLIDIIVSRSKNNNPSDEIFTKLPENLLYKSWDDFHQQNKSEFGPKGLLRHKIDGQHCIGHGEGTWDLIIGEFC